MVSVRKLFLPPLLLKYFNNNLIVKFFFNRIGLYFIHLYEKWCLVQKARPMPDKSNHTLLYGITMIIINTP